VTIMIDAALRAKTGCTSISALTRRSVLMGAAGLAALPATAFAQGRLPSWASQNAPAPQPIPTPRAPGTATVQAQGPEISGVQAWGVRNWQEFKRRFVTADGRVVDVGNGGVTHTEGQGLGMLYAVSFDDQATFDLLLGWTARNLRRPGDALHAWRFVPQARPQLPDMNNATDGDIYIAAALARASQRWGRPDQAMAAACIARDVLRLLVCEVGGRTVLLPGASGFDKGDAVIVNLSYYAFPFLDDLARVAPSPTWQKIRDDGVAMMRDGRFGPWQLPPDWLAVSRSNGALQPAGAWPARFSYDAIRVPLWLAWSGLGDSSTTGRFAQFWASNMPSPPAWVDLRSGARAEYAAPSGMRAVAWLSGATPEAEANTLQGLPNVATAPDYYSAALILLVAMAVQDRGTARRSV
jgi:endoglucanase